MRRLMGVLREDEASYAPQPGLEEIDALAAGSATQGCRSRSRATPSPASPCRRASALAAYRIVQEALTNAHKHAGAEPRDRRPPAARRTRSRSSVRNERGTRGAGGNGGGGRGLAGMRERVRVFGGELEAGPQADGGFAVHARLPLEEAE